jgi:predicted CXXCH cytochrome family protein
MRGRWVALAVVAAGALAAAATYVVRLREATAPPAPEAYVDARWQVYRAARGHEVHVGEQHIACTKCHTAADGGLAPPPASACVSCHDERARIHHGLGHEELIGGAAEARPALHGADAALHEAPASSDAAAVLLRHDADASLGAPANAGLSRCVDCHTFGPDPDLQPTDCIRCHAAAQGDLHAVTTHATAPCRECHDVHQNEVKPKECTQCHTVDVKHGHGQADVATQCRVCHDVHASAHLAQERCTGCHATSGPQRVPQTAVFAGGHSCASCHTPHGFDRESVKACASCHTKVHPLQGHEKAGCTSCHDPHAVKGKTEGGAVCVTCHKDVALVHIDKGVAQTGACIGCHVPHPPKGKQGPEACTSCHTDVGGAAHTAHAKQLSCTSCHAPHAFQRALDKGLCASCHTAQVSALNKRKEHKECTGCHVDLPHGLPPGAQPCGACHQPIRDKVHQGHENCIQCHDPHQAKVQIGSCSHCHQQQAELHPRGHDQCAQCHETHSGGEKPGVADCSACHKRSKLSGLHTEPKHMGEKGCLQCHAAHGAEQPGERRLCLSCHEERVDHQPDATRCDGCHTFIGAAKHGRGTR